MQKIFSHCFPALLLLFLSACSQDFQQDFAKIQPGMSYSQVIEILGKPTQINNITIDGFSGTSATWHSKNAVIIIEFINDKVQIKAITDSNNKNNGNS